jgi:hypothetical protein
LNALVLAIAGVLVVVGIALIVLSVVLARKRATPEEPAPVTPLPATGTQNTQNDIGGSTRPDKED